MQEILPSIKQSWALFCKDRNHDFQCINVDLEDFKQYKNKLLVSDFIIVSAFNLRICNFLIALRKSLKIDTPFILYVHGMSSIYSWPLHFFGLSDILTSRDVFTCSSSRDLNLFKRSYLNSTQTLIPFGLDIPVQKSKNSNKSSTKRFVYIGRLSSQKNIHSLIFAFYLYKHKLAEDNFHLDIFGEEDGLGSPNMGIKDKDYTPYLKILTSKLGLDKFITFHGFVDRDKLFGEILPHEYIFINFSIHSDENFGMALLRGLSQGATAIVTNWGGHFDFSNHFPEQVRFIKVFDSDFGPVVDYHSIISNMEMTIKAFPATLPKQFNINNHHSFLKNALDASNDIGHPLQISSFSQITLQARNTFSSKSSGYDTKIFNNYNDPIAKEAFFSYGMEKSKLSPSSGEKAFLVPWVILSLENIQIENPHTGCFFLPRNVNDDKNIYINDCFGQMHSISKAEFDLLASQRLLIAI